MVKNYFSTIASLLFISSTVFSASAENSSHLDEKTHDTASSSISPGFSTARSQTESQTSQMACSSKQDLIEQLKIADKSFKKIQDFIELYGLEIVKEPNLEQQGSLQGSLSGHISGGGFNLQLGSVGELVKGVVSGLELAPVTAGLSLNPLSSALSGLNGWGFGKLSIEGKVSGTIQGKFEGHGVQIHQDANVFLMMVKGSSVEKTLNDLKKMQDEASKNGLEVDNKPLIEKLEQLWKNPYVISDNEVLKFIASIQGLKQNLRCIDEALLNNIESDEPVFKAGQARLNQMQQWLRPKRLLFAQVAPKGANLNATKAEFTRIAHEPKADYSYYDFPVVVAKSSDEATRMFDNQIYPNLYKNNSSQFFPNASASFNGEFQKIYSKYNPTLQSQYVLPKLFQITWSRIDHTYAYETKWSKSYDQVEKGKGFDLGISLEGVDYSKNLDPLYSPKNIQLSETRLLQ